MGRQSRRIILVLLACCAAGAGRSVTLGDTIRLRLSAMRDPGAATPAVVEGFRTFVPDSLTAKQIVKRKSIATSWRAEFQNTTPDIVSSLVLRFDDPVMLTWFAPFPEAGSTDGGNTWIVSGQSLAPGDLVTVDGQGPPSGTVILSWHFDEAPANPGFAPAGQIQLLAMPNSANVRNEVFSYGGFAPGTTESDQKGGMVVGKSFLVFVNSRWRVDLDSARLYGWVRLNRQTELRRSLVYGASGLVHTGPPRGFCQFDNGRAFTRESRSLPPVKQNNRLFAGVAVLKFNIAASQLGVTPPGLGELRYNDPGHPLHGFSILAISAHADSHLTYCGSGGNDRFWMLDSVVRKINEAFSGPIDTLSFGHTLALTGVRPVGDVPFLQEDPSTPPLRIPRVYMAEYDEEDEVEAAVPDVMPEVIQLFGTYPNPFNPAAFIHFELLEFATVSVHVYDLLGKEVAVLADREPMFDGVNEVRFDAGARASGIYFYRIVAESTEDPSRSSTVTGKLLFVK